MALCYAVAIEIDGEEESFLPFEDENRAREEYDRTDPCFYQRMRKADDVRVTLSSMEVFDNDGNPCHLDDYAYSESKRLILEKRASDAVEKDV